MSADVKFQIKSVHRDIAKTTSNPGFDRSTTKFSFCLQQTRRFYGENLERDSVEKIFTHRNLRSSEGS